MSLLITFDIDAMEKDIVHSFSTVSSKVEVVCLVEGIGGILNFMEYVYSIQQDVLAYVVCQGERVLKHFDHLINHWEIVFVCDTVLYGNWDLLDSLG